MPRNVSATHTPGATHLAPPRPLDRAGSYGTFGDQLRPVLSTPAGTSLHPATPLRTLQQLHRPRLHRETSEPNLVQARLGNWLHGLSTPIEEPLGVTPRPSFVDLRTWDLDSRRAPSARAPTAVHPARRESFRRSSLAVPATVLHVAIVALMLLEMEWFTHGDNNVSKRNFQWLARAFTPSDDPQPWEGEKYRLHGVKDAVHVMSRSYAHWRDAPHNVGTLWEYHSTPQITVHLADNAFHPSLSVHSPSRHRAAGSKSEPRVIKCNLTEDNPLGPFTDPIEGSSGTELGGIGDRRARDCRGISGIWWNTLAATAEWTLRTPRVEAQGRSECETYHIKQVYNLEERNGLIILNVAMKRKLCSGGGSRADDPVYMLLTLASMVMAIAGMFLRGVALWRYRALHSKFSALVGGIGIGDDVRFPAVTEDPPVIRFQSATEPGSSPGSNESPLLLDAPPVVPLSKLTRAPSVRRQDSGFVKAASVATVASSKAGLDWRLVREGPEHLAGGTVVGWRWLLFGFLTDVAILFSRFLNATGHLLHGHWFSLLSIRAMAAGVAGFMCCIMVAHDVGRLSSPGFKLFVVALESGAGPAFFQLVGNLPIFFAFAFAATHFFGHRSTSFLSFDNALVLLFGLANGDSVHDMFDAAGTEGGVYSHLKTAFSRVFMYAFCCMSMYCVVMSFLAIMEDAYFHAVHDLCLDLEAGRRIGGVTGKDTLFLATHQLSPEKDKDPPPVDDVAGSAPG
eukprot:TRINITY_DN47183_c0_g1_i1.p1 TRINITY_DN47183_c0_g1~~TRINITY_DN47183_c0_g1_i1.p1  ORF type:complete len:774 (+),score=125.45 TRINITY_DN47183_c0_g1_i1:111-2324(+)